MKRNYLCGLIVGSSLLSMGMVFGPLAPSDAATVSATPTSVSASCTRPTFPAGTPAPTSVTGPLQPSPSSSAEALIGAEGVTESVVPVCQWIMSFDPPSGDPTVTYTEYSNVQMNLGAQYGVDYSNSSGVSCDITVDTLNGFGGGGAQETLKGSYCNTDGYVPGEGSVEGVLLNGSTGPDTTVASFNSTVTSYAPGDDIDYGFFDACSENPVGSHTNYACDYFFGGPSL